MRGAWLVLLVGCSDAPLPPPISDTDASPPLTHTGGPSCSFETAAFSLPAMNGAASPPLPALEGETKCAQVDAALDWFLADFDEDGFVDLVVTASCDDPSVGASRWLVYPGATNGFGAALSYAIPQAAPGCLAFGLADVDVDGALDLVVTHSCNDASVGTSKWLVYRNAGGTFASSPTAFALPSGYPVNAFDSMERDGADCANGKPAFAFFDVTGDAFADLVVTTACDDITVGVSQWRVYPGSASGLGGPTSFPLPGAMAIGAPFSGAMSCTATPQAPAYTLADFDGDGKVDIVVTQRCNDSAIGASAWDVYTNQGAAFAPTPTVVLLPDFAGEATPAFPIASGATSCATGTLRWTLTDVDGDFKPDLVVTQTCTTAPLAAGDWLVFPNGGTSFANAKTFGLPIVLGSPTALTGAMTCSGTTQLPAFQATHFFGDELDLIETESCTDTTIGTSRWIVHQPTCPQ